MYTVTVTRGNELIDIAYWETFAEVCMYARLFWMADPANIVTWNGSPGLDLPL